jgi:hypothetical protein
MLLNGKKKAMWIEIFDKITLNTESYSSAGRSKLNKRNEQDEAVPGSILEYITVF